MRTLYRAAHVYTPVDPAADTLLVDDDGTLAWLGAAAHAGDADLTIDLGDTLITPAFVDAHTHLTETGLLLHGLDLTDTHSVTDILDLVSTAARHGTDPLLGHGWDERCLAEHRPPTAAELDRAGHGAAVYLSRIDIHSAVISNALARSSGATGHDGWDGTGRVERDAHHAARTATRQTLSPQARRQAQLDALTAAAAAGIAAVHEMSGPYLAPDEDLRCLIALAAEPEPALPAVVPYRGELVTCVQQARAVVDRLALDPLGPPLAGLAGDLVVDGSIGSRTAAYHDDYADAPGHRGHLYLTAEQIRDHVTACTRAGLQAGFHVIGDAATDTALRGIRRAAGQVGIAGVRAAGHRLEHVETIDAEGIADLTDLNLTASVQPAFDARWGGDTGLYAARLGVDRALAMNPLAALARAGVALAFGSDSPVTPFDPWAAVRACLAHHVPRHRLDGVTAFAAHTTGGRRAAGSAEDGLLTVGAPATFAVWDVDGPLTAHGLPALDGEHRPPRCLLTVAGGRVLHDGR